MKRYMFVDLGEGCCQRRRGVDGGAIFEGGGAGGLMLEDGFG